MVAPLGLAPNVKGNSTCNKGWSNGPIRRGYANPRYAPRVQNTVELCAPDGTSTRGSFKDKGFPYKYESKMATQVKQNRVSRQRRFHRVKHHGRRTFSKTSEKEDMSKLLEKYISEVEDLKKQVVDVKWSVSGAHHKANRLNRSVFGREDPVDHSSWGTGVKKDVGPWTSVARGCGNSKTIQAQEKIDAQRRALHKTCIPLDAALKTAEQSMRKTVQFAITLESQANTTLTLACQSQAQFKEVSDAMHLENQHYVSKKVGTKQGGEVCQVRNELKKGLELNVVC